MALLKLSNLTRDTRQINSVTLSMKQLKVSITLHSIAGTKPKNQDACAYHIPEKQVLEYKGITSVIADGVSACERATEVSNCCVNSFLSDYYSTPDFWRVEHSATKVISALNNWLYSQSIRNDEISSMLSTLSVIIIKSNTAHIFHVGDSRIYRYRQGVLIQVTKDHILNLSKEKTYLSRVMGFDLKVDVDYQTFDLEVNDKFLMTTDGVHDYLDDTSLKNLMRVVSTASDIVGKALDSDSSDNILAMIVKIDQLPKKNIDEVFNGLTERPVPPDLDKGMKINGFEIESLFFSSPKMQLYLAKNINTKQLIVLKTPSINFEDDPQYLKYFMYEQWAGQRIQSPNVVKIHNSNEKASFLAYAMEYIKGQTLRQWMNEHKRPDIKIVVSFVKQIIQGLRTFHRQEMLHCDLKPENIMIDKIGQIKLIDFGSTRIAGIAELSSVIDVMDHQGTQGYTVPEVILNGKTSQASDQFSLGVIVYEIFSSQLPYQNKLDKKLTTQKLFKLSYESILMHNRKLSIWIDSVVRKACHLDAASRYNVLSEFLYDLEHVNSNFLQIAELIKPRGREAKLKKHQLYLGLLFVLNFILLLLLVNK